MSELIVVLPGDGVGGEVTAAAVEVLGRVAGPLKLDFTFQEAPVGGAAIDLTGDPLPEETFALARSARAVLLGAVGGPKWDDLPMASRPEQALMRLRKGLGLFANLRPVRTYPSLLGSSPLKEMLLEGVDILIVRELTGGVYFGEPRGQSDIEGVRSAFNTMIYSEDEIRRITEVAFKAARTRRFQVTSVDKANVLETSRLWRQVAEEVAAGYPDVKLRHMYIDNCAMQLIIRPSQFDVLVTSNLFGDILSDEAAVLGGSIGLLPSASLGLSGALYEPIHGSAPDIAGENKANPIGTILSAAMMLRLTFGCERGAAAIERAVELVLEEGYATADLVGKNRIPVGTAQMGRLVGDRVIDILSQGDGA